MVKPFFNLMFALFLPAAALLAFIYWSWHENQAIRNWQTLRLRAYERYYRGQYDDALAIFSKARSLAAKLDKKDYRYARSLQDMALVFARQSRFDKAQSSLQTAIKILALNAASNNPRKAEFYLNEELLAFCRLLKLELKWRGAAPSWELLSQNEALLEKLKKDSDPFVARTLGMTLLELASAASQAKNKELINKINSKTEQLEKTFPDLSGIVQQTEELSRKNENADSLDLLLNNARSALKAKNFELCRNLLAQALKESGSDPLWLSKINYQLSRLKFSENDFAAAEKLCLQLCNDPYFADPEKLDDNLNHLVIIYKIAGSDSEHADALRKQIEVRSKVNGPLDWKTIELSIELAIILQRQGKLEEAAKIADKASKSYSSARGENPGDSDSSERLALLLAGSGKLSKAKAILQSIAGRAEEGMSKKPVFSTLAFVDLAAISALESNAKGCKDLLARSKELAQLLDRRSRFVLAEGLLHWAVFLKQNTCAADFAELALELSELPKDRREAFRASKDLSVIKKLKNSNPALFNAKMLDKLTRIEQASSKFEPANLSGPDSKDRPH